MAETQQYIPDQVRRQIARAEELQKELVGDSIGDEGELPPTEAVSREGEETTARPGGEPPPVAATEPAAAPPPTSHPDWEQRYRTLQGKYDSEMSGLRAQVQSMERLVATMQAPPASREAPPPASGPIRFEEGDIDIYGQDFLEAAARAAAARYEPVIADLRAHINRLEGGQSKLTAEQLQDRVFKTLDADPELAGWWQDVNRSPQFNQWLQGIDEFSGVSRNMMLQHAYSSGDAMRTGRFFKKYMAEQEHTAPRNSTSTPQTGYASRPNGANGGYSAGGVRLEDMVVPGRAAGSGGSGNGAPQPRIWSRSEITRFYHDRTRGKFKGREAESDALERDLLAANEEGRIR